MIKSNNKSIGILGGSFDPPHKGHLKISQIAFKKLNLKKIYWVVTKKNPFKKKTFFSLQERIEKCLAMTKKIRKIQIDYLDDKIKSSRTIKVLKYFRKKNKNTKIYLVIGSDTLINFHKWTKWKDILQICELVVFSRKGFDKKGRKSVIMKHLGIENTVFIKKNRIDISSSKLRKNYLK